MLGAEPAGQARPHIFAEGLIGIGVPVGIESYSEERGGVMMVAGARAGAWLGRWGNGNRWGLEVQADYAEFQSIYVYTIQYEDPPGTIVNEGVQPAYSRVRVLAGGRASFPIHPRAVTIVHSAIGLDRVTGSEEENAPVLDVGGQIVVSIGPLRTGLDLTFAFAFHDNEHPLPFGTPPYRNPGYAPGYDKAVDLQLFFTLGTDY